jgi:hypothetical protein
MARLTFVVVALTWAAIVLGVSAEAAAAVPTKGQSAVAQVGSGTTAAATFSTNPTAGDTILVFVETGGSINSVVDNGSTPTPFTRDAFTTAGKGAYIYRANNISLPASGSYKVTVTTAAASTIQVKAIEFAGLASGPSSATNTGSGTGTTVSTNSVTSYGDAVLFGGFSDNSSQNPQSITFNSAGAGFVQDFVNTNGSAYWPAAEASAVVVGAATKSISWTLGNSSAWGAALAVYPAASGTGGDTTPPDTTITSGPPDPSTSGSASFSFSGADDVTPTTSLTYDCKLDAGTFAACSSPKSYAALGDGAHTFQVRARDAVGNLDPTPASQTWQISTGTTGTDRLPDLGMAAVSSFTIDTNTMPGHKLLRFTGVIANVGAGPFEIFGSRPSTSDANMSVQQHVYQTTGGYRAVNTDAVVYYAGDGHDHWHLKNLEAAQLTDVSGTRVGGPYAKMGFCFSDNAIYDSSVRGTPATAVYSGCANNQPAALSVMEGLSIGWGDWYGASVAFQWIDITDVPFGNYRFWAFADPNGYFLETNKGNNSTWTDVHYDRKGVKATAYGPHI